MAKDKEPRSGIIPGQITRRILRTSEGADIEISGDKLRDMGAKPDVDPKKNKAGFAPGMSTADRAKRAKGKK